MVWKLATEAQRSWRRLNGPLYTQNLAEITETFYTLHVLERVIAAFGVAGGHSIAQKSAATFDEGAILWDWNAWNSVTTTIIVSHPES